MFFLKYEYIKYLKRFLKEMKLILSYIVEFSEDNIIISKEYQSNYAVEESEKRPIIMIIHNTKIIFKNDR